MLFMTPNPPFFGRRIPDLSPFAFETFENEFLNIVAILFTALFLNGLIMVALEITIWYVLRSSPAESLVTTFC